MLFVLFAATLVGVALLHRRSLEVSLVGLALVLVVRVAGTDFALARHLAHEWAKLVNLLGLLVGFALVADHFERSHLPDRLPRVLPGGARGCFVLLVLVWLLSGVLDNIAAAIIGATVATHVFKGRVHLGYLIAVVACANAGGAGSVVGDTTTTMIWIEGISPRAVLPAYLGAATAMLLLAIPASRQQAKHSPPAGAQGDALAVDVVRVAIVAAALVVMVATNVLASAKLGRAAEAYPLLAAALWLVLLAGAVVRETSWGVARGAAKGGLFLVALVLSASLLPVQALPVPSWGTTLGLGFLSAVFDNIPLTKLALAQGGYDWGLLAFSIGFGGSMLWFGSSAGVAVANMFPEAQSVTGWLKSGWYVPLAFLGGYLVQLVVMGWNP